MAYNVIIDKSTLIRETVRRTGKSFDKVYESILLDFPDEFQRVNMDNICGPIDKLTLASMYQIVRFQFPKTIVYDILKHFKLKYGHFNISTNGLPHPKGKGLIVSKFASLAYELIGPVEYLFEFHEEPDYECFCDPIYELSPYLSRLSNDPAKAYEMSLSICPNHSTELIKEVFRSRNVGLLDKNTAYAMLIYDFDRYLSEDIIRTFLKKFKLSDMPSMYTRALHQYYTSEAYANAQLRHGIIHDIDVICDNAVRDALRTQHAIQVLCLIPNKVTNYLDMLNVQMVFGLARKRKLKPIAFDRIVRYYVEHNMFVEFEAVIALPYPISQNTLNTVVISNTMKFARSLTGKFNTETLELASSLNLTDMYIFICSFHEVTPTTAHLERSIMLNNTQLSIYIERRLV